MNCQKKTLFSTLLHSVLAYALAILLCFACVFSVFFYLAYEGVEEQNIEFAARSAADNLNGESREEIIVTLDHQLSSTMRYTLVDEAGQVVFDSDGNVTENHANRPEIAEAREKGASAVTRYSSTLGRDTIYAAVLLPSGDVLRIAEERASFFAVFESTAPALTVALIVAVLLSLALSRTLSRRVVAPLNKIDVTHPLKNETYEEMQPLLSRIESQQQQLKDQNSELARAENMRREFSANVSHELKTPLQVISGYAELISHGGVPDQDAKNFAEVILVESENMTALIDDVLTLSRIDDPVMESAGKEEVELLNLAHEVATRLKPVADKRSIRIRCLGSTVVVAGNRGLLDQLISNLLSNAVKYSDLGSDVTVSVGKNLAVPDNDAISEAYVKIKDNGCGIPLDAQAKIFERFYRVDKSRSKESGGTGLGLAIAKHAAEFHNASISVYSIPEQGSTFTVRFPLK